MRVRIEIDPVIEEDEIIIKCQEFNQTIQKIQKIISDIEEIPKIIFYHQDKEYYFSFQDILFFETGENCVYAHTIDQVFEIKYRLYELEEMLPSNFIRVSKSTILNIYHIYSIKKDLTSSSTVQFNKSHKQVFVSRFYYKALKQRLEERRNYEI